MTIKNLILALPVLCFACGKTVTDDANDAAGTGSPYLAKEVVGVSMLSSDADYDKACNILGEEYVRSTFNVGEETKIEELDEANGCEFEWSGNKVGVAFGGHKPFESIYQAEYEFNKMYQDGKGKVSGQMSEAGEKAPLSGPEPEGTGAELPAVTPEGPKRDSSAKNDTSNSVSGITSAAVESTPKAVSTGRFVAVTGIGDKAVWEPAKGAMHVLYNNHIVSVMVETKDKPAVRKQHAQSLALVMVDKLTEGEATK